MSDHDPTSSPDLATTLLDAVEIIDALRQCIAQGKQPVKSLRDDAEKVVGELIAHRLVLTAKDRLFAVPGTATHH